MQSSALFLLALLGTAVATPLKDVYKFNYPRQECPEPTPDPNPLVPGPMNISLGPIFEIAQGTMNEGGLMSGHSDNTIEIGIVVITLALTFNLHIPNLDVELLEVTGPGGYIDFSPFTSVPGGNFTTVGDDSTIMLRNLRIRGNAQLFINIIGNKVNIRTLNVIEFSFDDICVDFGSIPIGDGPVDWVDFCANFKSRFAAEWGNAGLRDQLIERIREAGNGFVANFTLAELIDLIGGEDPNCP